MSLKIRALTKQSNQDIRNAKGEIPQWMVARRLGVSEQTFIRWMREEIIGEKKSHVLQVIAELKKEIFGT